MITYLIKKYSRAFPAQAGKVFLCCVSGQKCLKNRTKLLTGLIDLLYNFLNEHLCKVCDRLLEEGVDI